MDLQKKMRDGRHQLWLVLARRGNEDAFRRLYRELYGPVAGYVSARVPNPQDAEDLVSEVFSKFLDGLGGYQVRRGSVMTWIVAMARNRVIGSPRNIRDRITTNAGVVVAMSVRFRASVVCAAM